MLLALLTLTGVLSIVLIIRSVFVVHDNFLGAVLMGIFGFVSFVLTAVLTNVVSS